MTSHLDLLFRIYANLLFLVQILAGNARKVSAVRFERINNDDEMLETKEVTRLVPKIMKRKWSDEDSDVAEYDGDVFSKRSQDGLSDENEAEDEQRRA